MKALKYLPLIACLIFGLKSNAQKGELKFNANYSYAFPLGNFKSQVVSNSSPRGVTGSLTYGINNKLSVGLGLGYQDFYQKYPRDVYKTGDNETTSAVLSNSVQLMPVLATAEARPLGGVKSAVQPYISVGAGIGITSFTQYLGEFPGTNNASPLMLQGGAGIEIPMGYNGHYGFRLGANYNYVNYKNNGFNNFNNVNIEAGVFLPLQ